MEEGTYCVMIVEDEPLERLALKMELESDRYHFSSILEAPNGQIALELFERERPELLLVDLNIPVLSGLSLIEKIVKTGAPCKIIITTTYDKTKYVRTAISLGVADYLLKPIDYDVLYEKIEKCLARLDAERQRKRQFESIYSYTQHYILKKMLAGELSMDRFCDFFCLEKDTPLYLCLLIWTETEKRRPEPKSVNAKKTEKPETETAEGGCGIYFQEEFAALFPRSNEPGSRACADIWRLPRGSNTPMLASQQA